jgi:transposase
MKKKVVFKDYIPNQILLLPPSLEELIPENHPVLIVNQVIDSIEIDPLIDTYKGGGTSSYHPRMLLKVLIYSYLSNIYSSRKIECALKENIYFMWLSGMNRPDHNTINRFRSDRLKNVLKKIFSEVVLLLADTGHVSLKDVYMDGTKIEANANRYSFVWGNSIKTNKNKIKQQLEELWAYTQQVAKSEEVDFTPDDFDPVSPEKVKDTIDKIDKVLKGKSVDKKIKQKLNYARKHWPKNLAKYQQQEKILNGRKSFSKTDPDATFMRMKEDHMRNGQLKPGYNTQITTNNQFILTYGLYPNPTDTLTMIPQMELYKQWYQAYPKNLTADAGYGSEENYMYCRKNKINPFVKFNYFDIEKKRKQKYPFSYDQLGYNKDMDCFYCPTGQEMTVIGSKVRITESGYKQFYTRYQAKDCFNCKVKCHKQKGNRIIDVNHNLQEIKKEIRELLNSNQGIYHRKKRTADVEPVFAHIKHNRNFRRFNLRGKKKVEIELGLLALAHNIKKIAA